MASSSSKNDEPFMNSPSSSSFFPLTKYSLTQFSRPSVALVGKLLRGAPRETCCKKVDAAAVVN